MSKLKCSAIGCGYEATTIVNGDALCAFHYENLVNEIIEKHREQEKNSKEVKI